MTALEFRPLAVGHLDTIVAQPGQQLEQLGMIDPQFSALLAQHTALGAWVGPRIIAAAGIVPMFPGEVAIAWCLLSKAAGRYMLPITRKCRQVLNADPTIRVEMFVNEDIPNGGRWATRMGFVQETTTPLRKRGKGGKDQHIFARVRG